MLADVGCWAMLGFGSWSVLLKSDGRRIGQAGFPAAVRDMNPPFADPPFREGEVEAGWAFHPDVHGQGIAGEAVAATLAWFDAALIGRVCVELISPENGASIRLAERQGFRERLRTLYHGKEAIQFERRV